METIRQQAAICKNIKVEFLFVAQTNDLSRSSIRTEKNILSNIIYVL